MIPSITISSIGSKFSPIVLQGDYAAQINLASALGFKAVELHVRNPSEIHCRAISQAVEATGLVVSTIGTGQAYVDEDLYFTSEVPEIRRAAVQRIMDQIDFAKNFGAKVIIGTIKGPLPRGGNNVDAVRTMAINCLIECAEYAEKMGVGLALEAINRYETNFLNNASEVIELIKMVGSSAIGLHLDTFHMNIEEVSIEDALWRYKEHLVHVHVADSNRQGPGRGHVNFLNIVRCLKAAGYQGFLGVECLPLPDPSTAAESALGYLERLISLA